MLILYIGDYKYQFWQMSSRDVNFDRFYWTIRWKCHPTRQFYKISQRNVNFDGFHQNCQWYKNNRQFSHISPKVSVLQISRKSSLSKRLTDTLILIAIINVNSDRGHEKCQFWKISTAVIKIIHSDKSATSLTDVGFFVFRKDPKSKNISC